LTPGLNNEDAAAHPKRYLDLRRIPDDRVHAVVDRDPTTVDTLGQIKPHADVDRVG
jgi:hypothetical protein